MPHSDGQNNNCSCDICAEVNAFLAHKTQTSHEIYSAGAGSYRCKHFIVHFQSICARTITYTTHNSSVKLMKVDVQTKRKEFETRSSEVAAIKASQTYFVQLLASVPAEFKATAATAAITTTGGGGSGGGSGSASSSGGGTGAAANHAAPATASGAAAAAAGAGAGKGGKAQHEEVLIDLTVDSPPAKRSKS